MAFSKFDPHREDDAPREEFASPQARRRALLLRYGWWITMAYTGLGFILLGIWWWKS